MGSLKVSASPNMPIFILYVPGGLEKATREDLMDALRILDEQAANAGKPEEQEVEGS